MEKGILMSFGYDFIYISSFPSVLVLDVLPKQYVLYTHTYIFRCSSKLHMLVCVDKMTCFYEIT